MRLREIIEAVAVKAAGRHQCDLAAIDGMRVFLAGDRDAFLVGIQARGVRGRVTVPCELDADLARACETGSMEPVMDAVTASARQARSLADIDPSIRALGIGSYCPRHRPVGADDVWPHVVAIDVDAWTFGCTVEAVHTIPWSKFAALVGDTYRVRERGQ